MPPPSTGTSTTPPTRPTTRCSRPAAALPGAGGAAAKAWHSLAVESGFVRGGAVWGLLARQCHPSRRCLALACYTVFPVLEVSAHVPAQACSASRSSPGWPPRRLQARRASGEARSSRCGAFDRCRAGHGQLDELRPHLQRTALFTAEAGERREHRPTGLGLERGPGRCAPRAGSDTAHHRWRHVCDHRVEQAVCVRCRERQATVGLRSEGAGAGGCACLLRRRQPWRRGLGRQAVCRHPRWPFGGCRRGHRQGSVERAHYAGRQPLHHHRRPARGEGQGTHRQRRRRAGCAWLCHRLRRGYRQAAVALLYRAGEPGGWPGKPGPAGCGQDLDG